ncbi:uncharacterized protein M8220_002735 isoform 2-T2 [Acridotheres tristis]
MGNQEKTCTPTTVELDATWAKQERAHGGEVCLPSNLHSSGKASGARVGICPSRACKQPQAGIWNSENGKHFVRGHQFDTRNSLLCKSLIKTEIEVVVQPTGCICGSLPTFPIPPSPRGCCWLLAGPGCQKREHGIQQRPSLNVPSAASDANLMESLVIRGSKNTLEKITTKSHETSLCPGSFSTRDCVIIYRMS